jgi:hypothetical protein
LTGVIRQSGAAKGVQAYHLRPWEPDLRIG